MADKEGWFGHWRGQSGPAPANTLGPIIPISHLRNRGFNTNVTPVRVWKTFAPRIKSSPLNHYGRKVRVQNDYRQQPYPEVIIMNLLLEIMMTMQVIMTIDILYSILLIIPLGQHIQDKDIPDGIVQHNIWRGDLNILTMVPCHLLLLLFFPKRPSKKGGEPKESPEGRTNQKGVGSKGCWNL